MPENPWYSFYVGDYAQKTAHLSLLEHGAYRLLLDHYYSTRSPLPNDLARLYRICRARSPSERKAVSSVIADFFVEDGTLLRNIKCDSELEKLLNYSNRQSAAAKLRHSRGTAAAQPHTRVPQPQPKKMDRTKVLSYTPDFETFWSLYPRKDCSKSEGFKAYHKATTEGADHGRLIAGVTAFSRHAERNRMEQRFIPHATTWLNQRRWESDYSDDQPRIEGKPANNPQRQSSWHAEGDRLAAKYREEAERERQRAAGDNPQ